MTASGIRICSFESRRAEEMRSLIERQKGIATVVPSMREKELAHHPEVFQFAESLIAGDIDLVVFMTGVGTRLLREILELQQRGDEFLEALGKCQIAVRGPKPAAVLRKWNVSIQHRAPEPNTWQELLSTLENERSLDGETIAVQEYGQASEDFYRELEKRGAKVIPVPVYRWELPEDTQPLISAIHSTISDEFDVLMFTSAQQLTHVLMMADSEGCREEWISSANKCVIASIGPTATATLESAGLPVDVEASPPKMGQLVRQTLQAASTILSEKPSRNS